MSQVPRCVGYSIPMRRNVEKQDWRNSLCEMCGLFICQKQGCDIGTKGWHSWIVLIEFKNQN